MTLSYRERRLALGAGLIGGAVILYLLVDRWAFPTWQGLPKEISQKESDVRDLNKKVQVAQGKHPKEDRS